MKNFLPLLFLLCTFPSLAQSKVNAQTDPYSQTLARWFDVSGGFIQYAHSIDNMMRAMRPGYIELSEEDWKVEKAQFMATAAKELVEVLTPVYRKHLTLEDLQALIAFYESPVGKKYARVGPAILNESMEAGQEWGSSLRGKFEKQLEE